MSATQLPHRFDRASVTRQPPPPAHASSAEAPAAIDSLEAWTQATAVPGERRGLALQHLDRRVAEYLSQPDVPQKLQALQAANTAFDALCQGPSVRAQRVACALDALYHAAASRGLAPQQGRRPAGAPPPRRR